MFGNNDIVGKAFFKKAPTNTLQVTSMFFTLQGEGPYGGLPSLFIRLSKCNLACSFCDTFFDRGDDLTFEDLDVRIFNTITQYWTSRGLAVPQWIIAGDTQDNYTKTPGITKFNCVLVITGGEPMLQSNLAPFLEKQVKLFKNVQIESNGIVSQKIPPEVTLVCSPKCLEKDRQPIRYLEPTREMLGRADCLKFVMCADKNSPYSSVPQWGHDWARATGLPVYVSPMNIYNDLPHKAKKLRAEKTDITMEERSTVDEVISFWEPGLLNMKANQENHEYAARYCMDHGFRLNLQVHLYASLA